MTKHTLNFTQKTSFKALLVIGLSTFFILSVASCSKEEEAIIKEVIRPAKIMTIGQAGNSQTRKYPGKVQALDRVELSFEVSGKLVNFPVNAGQDIKKGDVIAQIDPSDYQSKLDSAKAKANQAKTELARFENLLKEKVVAKSNYDVKKRNYDVAAANVNIAQKAVDDTKLLAPFSGRIGIKYVDNFQVVQAKEPIVALQKKGAIEIIVNAPEKTMATSDKNNRGRVSAEFSALPGKRYPLTIKEFSTEADPQTQTYRVVLTMPTPKDATILDGMTATVFHTLAKTGGGSSIEVPSQAVFSDEKGQTYVWSVTEEMQVKRHPVSVGPLSGSNIEIVSGLNSGSRIVIAGVQNLVDGQKIREFTGIVGE